MKRDNKAFYEFFKKNCEFRKEVEYGCVCKKNKIDKLHGYRQCHIEICPYIKKENQDILNPACELLRILDIDFYHEQRTSTSKRDILKSNKSLPDLIIFMDKKLLTIELKKPGKEKLSGGQLLRADRFRSKEYIGHYVVSDLGKFSEIILSIASESELFNLARKRNELKKWLDKNQIGCK
jgi:hypothetical protein